MKFCIRCHGLNTKPANRYCSTNCRRDYHYEQYIKRWRRKLVSGSRGVHTKNISQYVRRYLREIQGDACAQCGWSKINIVTGEVPLEVDHIDGNAENSYEENLRLICPNCRALLPP